MTSRALLFLFTLTTTAQPLPQIHWSYGPAQLALAGVADIPIAKGQIFIQDSELRRFLEASGNPPTGRELAVAGPPDLQWFAVISRENRISVDELRKAIVDGTAAANLIRARQGRDTLDVLGYREPPRFNPTRHLLTWTLDTSESGGRAVVNHFAYFLGRDSVIAFELVTETADYPSARPAFDAWLAGFRFEPGHEPARPIDWRLWLILAVCALSAWLVLRSRRRPAGNKG